MLIRWLAYRFIAFYDRLTNSANQEILSRRIIRILIVELTRIGDLLVATPTIKAIRKRYPLAQISMMVQKRFSDMILHSPYLNHVIGVQNSENLLTLVLTSIRLRKKNFDLVISLSPGIRNSWIAQFSGARYKVGYLNNSSRRPTFFNDHLIEARGFIPGKRVIYNRHEHLITRAAKAIIPLDIDVVDRNMDLFLDPGTELDIDKEIKQNHMRIVVHPGAGWYYKIWPKRNFAQLIEMLMEHYRHRKPQIIIIGGAEDSETLRFIASSVDDELTVLEGYPLSKVASLIKRSHLFIGNDSGPLHIAGAFGIPFIGLFGPSRPETVGPLSAGTFIRKEVECSPCRQIRCLRSLRKERTCMELIEVEEVFKAVEERITEMREV